MRTKLTLLAAFALALMSAFPTDGEAQNPCVKECNFHYNQLGIYTHTTCDPGENLSSCQDSTDGECNGQLCIPPQEYSEFVSNDFGAVFGVAAFCQARPNVVASIDAVSELRLAAPSVVTAARPLASRNMDAAARSFEK